MRVTVRPGGAVAGRARVPGDKSIAHRWLILAATARGRSELRGLPESLDVRSTARVLAALSGVEARAALEGWVPGSMPSGDGDRSTYDGPQPRAPSLVVEAEGRVGLHAPGAPLDCGNSGTTMRLMAGVLASCRFETELVGDESLSARPMERVAEPLRAMGAGVRTTDGHAPVVVSGADLRGIGHVISVPSAQVKGAVLLAGLAAEGETTVGEPVATRDHTERVLEALGAPVRTAPGVVGVGRFQHEGFAAELPGDVSSAAFLVAAAALTGSELAIERVGLNPTRTRFLDVLERMGAQTRSEAALAELGEPMGELLVAPCPGLVGTTVTEEELPLVIDEVPVLAMLATHARGETWFLGAAELRVKESDRLRSLKAAIRGLGGDAGVEGDALVIAGGGLRGGRASSGGDHRMAMSLAVAALAASGPVEVEGIEAADVSFPGFLPLLERLGARVDA